MNLIDKLRQSRRHPSVLKLKLLKIRGEAPDVLIFVYEGEDDIPVYEEWMRRIANCPKYEPVAGAGKQQLLALHDALQASGDPLIRHVFFFVDRDFDSQLPASPHVYELPAYSIENLICTEEVLDSLLRTEYKKAGQVAQRKSIKDLYEKAYKDFLDFCRPVDFSIFKAHRLEIPISQKPEKLTDIVEMDFYKISASYEDVDKLVLLERPCSMTKDLSLLNDYKLLPAEFRHRGKYTLLFFRRWLKLLSEEMKSQNSVLFQAGANLAGDPSSSSLARLASASLIPKLLAEFVVSAGGKNCAHAGV